MKLADAIGFVFEHGADTAATAGDVGAEAAAVMADGKVEPVECVDAAEAVAEKALHRFDVADKVIVEVPIERANQAALIHGAVEDIRAHATTALADRKLTLLEAVRLAAFAARRILRAIPSSGAQGGAG